MIDRALALGAAFAAAAFGAALVEAIKLQRRVRVGLSAVDAASIAAAVAAVGGLGALSPWAGAAAASLGALFFAGLWLDAVLFRVYSIEMGVAGVRSIVVPVLYRELSEVSFARDFLRAHAPFLAAPPLVAVALVAPSLPRPAAAPAALLCAAAMAPMLALAPPPARRSLAAWPLAAALAGAGLWAGAPALHAAAAVALAAALGLNLRGPAGPSVSAGFVRARRLPAVRGFTPRPEHAARLVLSPRPPRPSPARGAAAGSDVLLITIESLGRAHASLHGGPAQMPFLEAVARGGVRVRHHFSPCPMTNEAHQVLYGGEYATLRSPALPLLRAAGYRSAYLTPYRTAHYGLDELLAKAGFDAAIDRRELGSGRDRALLDRGLDLALGPERSGPIFLHVHTANAHLPYVVEDPARFSRFDAQEDLGRYLDALEEADALAAELAAAFERRRGPPLLIVSADHGQSFGALGYRSHGSGIVKEQVNVPLAMRHPKLAPAEVPWASHFDVLPGVLDLLGIDDPRPGFGDALLAPRGEPSLVLWAGRPARSTTSNCGVLLGDRKYMLDLVRGECMDLSWDDEARELPAAERAYLQALIASAFQEVGLK
ncbi:MAG TPA: sulfatase-like hydrolase/transferase [Myxococcaceae bacterium]